MTISERMKHYRKTEHMTQEKCARACGISVQTWNSIEHSLQTPSLITLGKIEGLIGDGMLGSDSVGEEGG